MKQKSAKQYLDSLLHPVRMRIMLTLAGSPGLSPLQIAERLNDVPQATLYRHIKRLAEAGVLLVTDERPVRGTLEKVYTLNREADGQPAPQDLAQISKEDHLRYFSAFMIALLDQYASYLANTPRVDMLADGVGYSQVAIFMSDDELAQFGQTVNAAIMPYLQPSTESGDVGQGRKKRIFATVMMPDPSGE